MAIVKKARKKGSSTSSKHKVMNLFAGVDGVLEPVADLLAGLAEHVRDVLRREGVGVDVDVPAGFALLRTPGLVDDAQVERIHREAREPVANL